jgi:type 1 glutamine amidotransferase
MTHEMKMRPAKQALHGPEHVRVIVPAAVANDINKMHALLDQVANRIGCGPCHSGLSLTFELEREFRVSMQGQLVEPGAEAFTARKH